MRHHGYIVLWDIILCISDMCRIAWNLGFTILSHIYRSVNKREHKPLAQIRILRPMEVGQKPAGGQKHSMPNMKRLCLFACKDEDKVCKAFWSSIVALTPTSLKN